MSGRGPTGIERGARRGVVENTRGNASGGENGGSSIGTQPRRIVLLEFRPLVKGALRGFATVALPIGLKISDIPVLVSHGKGWASMPSKPAALAGPDAAPGS